MQSNEVPQQILSTATVSLVLLLDQVDLQRQHRPLSGGWRTWVLGALAALLACNMSLGMLINAAGWNAPPPPVEAPVVGP